MRCRLFLPGTAVLVRIRGRRMRAFYYGLSVAGALTLLPLALRNGRGYKIAAASNGPYQRFSPNALLASMVTDKCLGIPKGRYCAHGGSHVRLRHCRAVGRREGHDHLREVLGKARRRRLRDRLPLCYRIHQRDPAQVACPLQNGRGRARPRGGALLIVRPGGRCLYGELDRGFWPRCLSGGRLQERSRHGIHDLAG